ncbi:hypothetical protein [Lentzea sp. NEAU-D7]|uniref:hypothetical protein n=1 Tax=Lentzea sp. NEAU-D7 TaxID=2994667 RepID=UPI00224B8C46|nr:hypothetical protein [Lentzea sp. NEAU-D7]MCX2947040.1 hypothetical protein [Lentzea sp. NEAU-D7]
MNRGNGHPGVHFLLSLIDQGDAAAVRRRLGIGEQEVLAVEHAVQWLDRLRRPRSVLLWILEEDDPATNRVLFQHLDTPDTIKRDILRGVPFGGTGGRLHVLAHGQAPEIPVGPRGVVGGLREARTMDTARIAARVVGADDWTDVAEADRAEPLPGYARWALTERIDCPPAVRAQFGSHAKFTHRLQRAGIVEPAEYVEVTRPPQEVLAVLGLGVLLFPRRAREAGAALAPLVHAEVGVDPDAWAVLAQLLPTFAGTVPELVRTSGAVARVRG